MSANRKTMLERKEAELIRLYKKQPGKLAFLKRGKRKTWEREEGGHENQKILLSLKRKRFKARKR